MANNFKPGQKVKPCKPGQKGTADFSVCVGLVTTDIVVEWIGAGGRSLGKQVLAPSDVTLVDTEPFIDPSELGPEDPFWDGTDAAHPAWWRGSDAGWAAAKQKIAALEAQLRVMQASCNHIVDHLKSVPGRMAVCSKCGLDGFNGETGGST